MVQPTWLQCRCVQSVGPQDGQEQQQAETRSSADRAHHLTPAEPQDLAVQKAHDEGGSIAAVLTAVLDSFARPRATEKASACGSEGRNYWHPEAAQTDAKCLKAGESLSDAGLRDRMAVWRAQALASGLKVRANQNLGGKLSQPRQEILDAVLPRVTMLGVEN